MSEEPKWLTSRRKKAERYLANKGIAATAPGSKLVYRDSAGVQKEPPKWLQQDGPLVITNVEPIRRKA